jgi:hypothetical protein
MISSENKSKLITIGAAVALIGVSVLHFFSRKEIADSKDLKNEALMEIACLGEPKRDPSGRL